MDITPVLSAAFQLIEAYGSGGFTIADKRYEGSVIILPEQTLALDAASMSELKTSHFEEIINATPKPEIVLIGVGATFAVIPPDLKHYLRQQGISSDAMDTGAACRTFNVLLAESRRVAAILFPIA